MRKNYLVITLKYLKWGEIIFIKKNQFLVEIKTNEV